jgi:ABC-type cobalamin/Fe3+-siderophores transport system ATPase subunit
MPENEIFGLTGPDGSGKTTLMQMLAGIMNLKAGDILYKDREIKSILNFFKNVTKARQKTGK